MLTCSHLLVCEHGSRKPALISIHSLEQGDAVCRSIESVLQQSTEEVQAFLRPFTLVVAANLPEELLVNLADACNGINLAGTTTTTTTTLPLVSVRAYGFLGTVRCQYANHEVVESKPDATKADLRIAQVPCSMYHAPCTCTMHLHQIRA